MSRRLPATASVLFFFLGLYVHGTSAQPYPHGVSAIPSPNHKFQLLVDERYGPLRLTLQRRSGREFESLWRTTWEADSFPSTVWVTQDGLGAALVCGWVPAQHQSRNVLAIFGPQGKVLGSYRLTDLFTAEELPRLRYSNGEYRWVRWSQPEFAPVGHLRTYDPRSTSPDREGPPNPLRVGLRVSLLTGQVTRE